MCKNKLVHLDPISGCRMPGQTQYPATFCCPGIRPKFYPFWPDSGAVAACKLLLHSDQIRYPAVLAGYQGIGFLAYLEALLRKEYLTKIRASKYFKPKNFENRLGFGFLECFKISVHLWCL